jgi:hypothetical protein
MAALRDLCMSSKSTWPSRRTIDDLQAIKEPQFMSIILGSCPCFGFTLHISYVLELNHMKATVSVSLYLKRANVGER